MLSKSILACLFLSVLSINALPHSGDSGIVSARNITIIDSTDDLDVNRKISTLKEPTKVSCPESLNGIVQGHNRNYAAIDYTQAQVKAAMLTGATLAAKDKTTGDNDYPHYFGNREELPFPCGKNLNEFPILINHDRYGGESVAEIPDRVVWEYTEDTDTYKMKFCGVMRHRGAIFVECP